MTGISDAIFGRSKRLVVSKSEALGCLMEVMQKMQPECNSKCKGLQPMLNPDAWQIPQQPIGTS